MPSVSRPVRWMVLGTVMVLVAPIVPFAGAATDGGLARVVVGFYEMPASAAQGSTYEGAPIVHADDALKFFVVTTDDPARFTARAQQDERVRYIELDGVLAAVLSPNDTYFANGQQYGPQRIRAPQAWDKTIGSTSASVCVIDSGVRLSHEDIGTSRYAGGIDYIDNNGEPNDQNGHGTFTSAIAIAGLNNGRGIAGMAAATWRHARVLDAGGSGSPAELGSAIRWCADNGAHIVSMSLGTSTDVAAMRDGAVYGWNAGAVLVAATGNNGCVGSNCIHYPGRYAEVIGVGSTDTNNVGSSFSNGGPEIDVVAPGSSIVSAYISGSSNSAYVTGSGTSASAPHVAGALAILKSYAPGVTNSQMRARLEATTLDLGAAGWDSSYGHGLVQTDAMLRNQAPSVTISCAPAATVTSRNVTCTMIGSDPEGHGIWVALDWGDGDTERVPATGSVQTGVPFSAKHRFGYADAYTITAVPTDDPADPLTGAARTTNVTIGANTAPIMRSITCSPEPSAANANVVCMLRADDDSDGVAYTVDWGDGTVERWPPTGFATPGVGAAATHRWLAEGFYDIYARPVDDATPALPGNTLMAVHEVRACSFARTGTLVAGGAGFEVDGVTKVRIEGIPPGCQEITFSLRGTGTLFVPDLNVCWYQGEVALRCDMTPGSETGLVPPGADAAEVILFSGADARYTLTIPA